MAVPRQRLSRATGCPTPTAVTTALAVISALVDSGAVHLWIPEPLAIQLRLAELERREVVLVDGHRRTVACGAA
ncbi:MAG: hypothetical protein ACK5N0_14410 [Synechococcaceae cyanobacterium]